MKLPSLHHIVTATEKILQRFPLVILDAAAGTLAAVTLIDMEPSFAPTILFQVLFATVLGLPLLLYIALVVEFRSWKGAAAFAAQTLGILVIVAYAVLLPNIGPDSPELHAMRLAFLAIGLHLLVAIAPRAAGKSLYGIWKFNTVIFMRALLAAVSALVLFGGLSLALAALDHLFGANIIPKRYGELGALIYGLFATLFFLAGVPERDEHRDDEAELPRGIHLFSSFVLGPLVIVYFIILYAYMGKILISWDWPEGWVSRLILGCATTGILLFLFFTPLREKKSHPVARMMQRWFWPAILPLGVMLMFAVWRRVSEYGFTEGRYIAFVLGGWLFVVAIFYLFSKGKPIRIIPGTLALLAFATSIGSWGAFSVSEQSQVARLRVFLEKDSILVNNVVRKTTAPVSSRDAREINSIVQYLQSVHGLSALQPWFREQLAIDSAGKSFKDAGSVIGMMGIQYEHVLQTDGGGSIRMISDRNRPIDIAGYDLLIRSIRFGEYIKSGESADKGISYSTDDAMETITVVVRNQAATDTVHLPLHILVDTLASEYGNAHSYNIPQDKMSLIFMENGVKIKLLLIELNMMRTKNVFTPTTLEFQILISLKKE